MHSLAKTKTLHLSKHLSRQPPLVPCSVKPIKGWLVPHYWDFVKGYIDSALEHANGELGSEDVYEYLLAEKMFLFTAQRQTVCGAVTCEVVQYARKKCIRVVTLSGEDFADWVKPLQKSLEDWCEIIKADGIEAYVRKGLVPQLETLGYKQTYIGMYHGKIIGKPDR